MGVILLVDDHVWSSSHSKFSPIEQFNAIFSSIMLIAYWDFTFEVGTAYCTKKLLMIISNMMTGTSHSKKLLIVQRNYLTLPLNFAS